MIGGELIGLIITVLIICIIIFAAIRIAAWAGVSIPQPVMIVIWAIVAIVCLIYLARFAGISVGI